MPLLDILRQPAIADRRVVETWLDVHDAGPGRGAVSTRADDVEKIGEVLPDPRPAVVLVGDGVNTKFGDQSPQFALGPRAPQLEERLRQGVGSAPGRDPKRAIIR